MAHPDDESFCTGTVYKLTHDYNAKVDLACITNGEGGYKYSTLLAFVGVLHRLAFVGVLHQQIEDEHKHKIVGEEHQRW